MSGIMEHGHRQITNLRRAWWMAVLLCLLVLSPALARPALLSADGPITMKVRVGFDGRSRAGMWTPVTVDIENAGPNVAGELVVSGETGMGMGGGPSASYSSQYVVAAALPQGARKQFTLYVPLTLSGNDVTVRLVQGDKTLAEAEGTFSLVGSEDFLVGVLSQNASLAAALPAQGVLGQGRGWTVVSLNADTLPPLPQALGTFDLILLGDFVTQQLRPEQTRALEDWVVGGGSLVAFGGAEARRTLGGLPESLLPMTVDGSTMATTVDTHGRWGGTELLSPRDGPPFAISTGKVTAGRTLATLGQSPLVVLADRGKGHVLFLAFDPSQPGAPGGAGLWRELLSRTNPEALVPAGSSGGPQSRIAPFQYGPIGSALSNLPALDLPSVKTLAGILAAYVLLVGPINYVVLRRLHRRAWSWLTIPLLVAVFSGGTFLLALRDKGSDVITSTISLVHLTPDSPRQRVESYVGVFAPSETGYRLSFAEGGLVSSLGGPDYGRGRPYGGPYGSQQGDPPVGIRVRQDDGTVELLGMSMWSMRSVMTERYVPLRGGLEARLRLRGNGLEGTVRNTTDLALQDSHILVGGSFAEVGDLGPGETKAVRMGALTGWNPNYGPPPIYQIFNSRRSHNPGPPTPEDRELMRKQQVLESVLAFNPKLGGMQQADGQPLVFFGWTDDTLGSGVSVDRQTPRGSALTAVIAALPLEPEGAYQVPAGLVWGYPVAADGGAMQAHPVGFQFAGGSVTLQFDAPFAAGKPVTALGIALTVNGNLLASAPFEAALYNWETGKWDPAVVTAATGSGAASQQFPPGGPMPPPAVRSMGPGGTVIMTSPAMPVKGGPGGPEYLATVEGNPADYLASDGTVRLKLTTTNRDTLNFGLVSLKLEGGSDG